MEKNIACTLALNVLIGAAMDGLIVCTGPDGSYIKITNKCLELIDGYGNKITITDGQYTYEHNAPSYKELYDYWKQHQMILEEI